MILNTEARRHRVFVFLPIAHRVNFPSLGCGEAALGCGEAADSVPSRHFYRQTVTELCVSVFDIN